MARSGHQTPGDGAGHPVLRARRPRDRIRAVGDGPLLVFGGRWVSHLEEEWDDPRRPQLLRGARADAIASCATTGSASGSPTVAYRSPPSIELEARTLGAVLDACGTEPATRVRVLLRRPRDGALRERAPSASARSSSSAATPRATTSRKRRGARSSTSSRVNWPLAAPDVRGPASSPNAAVTRSRRSAATSVTVADAEAAAAFLDLELTAEQARSCQRRDAGARAPPPRRSDRSDRPRARAGVTAPERALRRARRRLASAAGSTTSASSSARSQASSTTTRACVERRLAAERGARPRCCASSPPDSRTGRSPSSLVLSEHTVHRHVANMLRKLTQSSRAAAAAHATRVGLI